ncbi:proprotein convertase subtilisin/kexin type 5-like, partial [Chaetodon auriga]|uniref:proprotein convertase subtilisin/kexin type 5-like n=1 Tax=Chaetodon auriga TaxID=39042 RepID=UPI004032F2D1
MESATCVTLPVCSAAVQRERTAPAALQHCENHKYTNIYNSGDKFFDDGRCDIHCQKGRYAMGRQCHLCHHTCQECTDEGPDNCTSCDKDKLGVARYLFHGQCRDVCPEGFFHSARKQCEPCPADCLICTAADHCLHCSPGHRLRNNQCVPLECTAGEVADSKNEDCLPCDEGCKQCKRSKQTASFTLSPPPLFPPHSPSHQSNCRNKAKCTVASAAKRIQEIRRSKLFASNVKKVTTSELGTDCHHSCPDRTYGVDETMACAPCEDKQCVICDHSQCYWCEEGFYVFDGECVDHCKEGFFVDKESWDCEPCHRTCRTCGGPRYDDCDSCEDGFTLKGGECFEGKQLSLCSEKHFRNSQGDCELCHTSCKTCSAAGKEDCSSCYTGHFLTAQQTCMSHCPSGMFANKASNQCDSCLKGCVSCQDAQQCQRCRSGLYLHNGECVVECQRGFPQDGVCQPCAPECASCQGNSSYCLSCNTLYLLLDHSCRSHCLKGYYATETECLPCPAHCRECNQDGLCKKCDHYYFLHEDKCVDDCPDGYFASEQQQECVRCHADCASCDGPDIDDCDACRNPKAVRYNGKCLSQCPTSTYYDRTTNECRDCDRSCLTCSGHEPSSCLSCDTNRRKDASGHCVWYSQCSLRSYMDQNGECQLCHELCHRCSGPSKHHCLSCSEPHFLLNDTCVLKCPEGYYAEDEDERVCERCHFSCQSCAGRHSVQCVTCKPGLFKQGNTCVEFCSESHFGNTSTMVCERCDPSCRQCWGRGNTNCLSCREGYVYMRQWGQCQKSCPTGYYQDRLSKTCHKCHPTCKTCSDNGALACQSCYGGYTFMTGICVSRCLVGLYDASQGSEDEPICKACDPSCLD